MSLKQKISVVGLGYVGLPVAVAFGKKAKVIGYDINKKRVAELLEGIDTTREVLPEELKSSDIHFTSDPEDLREANFHIVAVPTPIDEAKQPDLRPLLLATETVGRILKPGDIVVYESTVFPGCTEENCAPILEQVSGLKFIFEKSCSLETSSQSVQNQKGKEFNPDQKDDGLKPSPVNGFYLGYSPERINPGDKEHNFITIKKVVSGSTPEITDLIAEVYASVVTAGVYIVSSIKVAEAAKVIENAQRDLNIAFVNELALIFNLLCIDTNEVLEAAGTKWNFLPFRPGLVGGHCIGVDPYYLTYKAEQAGYRPQVILSGRRINDSMGTFVAQQTVKTMSAAGIGTVATRVTVLGFTFKENCPDLRNSMVLDIIRELNLYGCNIQVHDPCCDPDEAFEEYKVKLTPLNQLQQAPAVIVAVEHQNFKNWSIEEWKNLTLPGGIIVDVKNVVPFRELEEAGHIVWRL